jgi:ribosomal protein L11 methyltransferase
MELYHAYRIESTDEIVLGMLYQYDFASFEENDDHIMGYIPSASLTLEVTAEIGDILDRLQVKYSVSPIENQNWNALWEASFQPVIVHDFCQIRADFHPAIQGVKHDLVINPKMAFGTGHHATTFMMIDLMASLNFEGKDVFDFGCGTGILAIMASKLGANYLDAVDIEQESYDNTIENASINDVHNIITYCGDMDAVPARSYDIVLANINRNILLRYADNIADKTIQGGKLLLSGILIDDADGVIEAYSRVGFTYDKSDARDGWKCIQLTKTS